ncbi:hypothetical protein C8K18_111177 [Paraburkholderia sp. GV068]|jgi:hypothetical protein|uniref:DUF2783 domain-containing protein n=1 Tax=Paraburkholderia graminis (strain ATCC 700544 / DSM 17151 / LMG 18924 / NCIMB 13744 / C4D1M) TaxID=396598 RepID=B1FTQ9_PARG4|nr:MULTISPECIES: hypothetical protein [Paraburkholderia]EDT13067.1 conserved hypothetical protein [Paraburkholderia graminis C4D1M]PTQ95358.1 hypothetical protein C8K19_112177 [Paraburkholderia sp. GV072]PUB02012.1 hypothetical protein C8K18_111177 [Paraburkholderia sp. GV068]CAB3718233.1 hypothetical protein R8871_04616 [Paraburkholderia graminis C4D1M]
MTDSDLDRVYTALCHTLTAEGEADAPLYLARLALLCITGLDDAQRALSLIEAARLPRSEAVTATAV